MGVGDVGSEGGGVGEGERDGGGGLVAGALVVGG